ncbi:MAG: HAMP domain-containing histidine kinase [Chitinophagales bacterium]|nr:HAMP domain-containing histidine kinase [Chitinophagaceae bacterium]MCB9066090.1 HAMP domain-containing histidine kinase [Chitinophagales bacterium]
MINQNLKVTRFTSVLVAAVSLIMILAIKAFGLNLHTDNNLYFIGWFFLLITSLAFYLPIEILRKKHSRDILIIKRMIGSLYPLILIYGAMWMSFVSGKVPANNMTMFMFALIFVGVSWIYTQRGAVLVSMLTITGIVLGLLFFGVNEIPFIKNVIASTLITIGFFLVSRLLYSYHVSHFVQLRIIEENNREITQMAKLKTEMLGIVAHDLRSPINSVTALVGLAKEDNATTEERQEYFNMILEACEESQGIIRDLISIVKGDSAQGLKLQEINANIFLSQIQQHWAHKLPAKKKLLLTLPETIVEMTIDEEKMLRVFDNLIGNAIKFTEDDGTIHIQLNKQNNDAIRISIADDGIGVPDEIKPYLFERFSKAGRLGLKGEKSHGLGLNICKQIVEQHNGKIDVVSKEGEGTTFIITLPEDAMPILDDIS